MNWTDSGLLLTVAQAGTRTTGLHVVTDRHGRCLGEMDVARHEDIRLLPGCSATIRYVATGIDGPGRIIVTDVIGGVKTDDASGAGLTIVRCVSDMLARLIGSGDPVPTIYNAARVLFRAVSEGAGDWPLHYVRFELALLKTLGLSRNLARCRVAHRHGETVFAHARTARCFTRDEAGAFVDQMIQVPSFLFGGRTRRISDILRGLVITRLLFEQSGLAGPSTTILPAERTEIVAAIGEAADIPAAPPSGPHIQPIEVRRRRLLSMRPLEVPGRTRLSGG